MDGDHIPDDEHGVLVAEVGHVPQHLLARGLEGLLDLLRLFELQAALDAVRGVDARRGRAEELDHAVAWVGRQLGDGGLWDGGVEMSV